MSPDRLRLGHRWRSALPEIALGLAAARLVVVGAWLAPPGPVELDLRGYLVALAGALVLVGRRRVPVLVVGVTWVCAGLRGAGLPGHLRGDAGA